MPLAAIPILRRMQSFGSKITLLITITSGLAVLLVSSVLVYQAHRDVRRETIGFIATQTNLMALNSEAPLTFADPALGEEALEALRAVPNVARGGIYHADGRLFAEYRAAGADVPRLLDSGSEPVQQGRWLALSAPVTNDEGERLGQVQIVYDMSDVSARMWQDVLLSLLASAAVTALAFLLATRIRRFLTRPVGELAATARQVSRTGDYSLRAAKYSEDELGQLTDVFNAMLAQIQKQAGEIRQAHEQRAALLESERAARAEAERASRMKDEFVATLSHELRTPLTAILGWAQMLRKSAGRTLRPEDEARGLEVIERNARMQTQIIEDLLDISRIVSGKIRLDVHQVNLAEVIEAAIATVRPAAEARGIRLHTVLDPNVAPVRGDAARLQQVVWNLASNAIKFTGRGGRVEVALQRVNSHVEIVVSDTGQGIKPEFLPHVFERFRQADGSTTRRHGGLGLGLAIVKQLVELHGGMVRARSPGENQGATFTVELPVMVVHPPRSVEDRHHPRLPMPVSESTAAPTLPNVRVLVVDDDPDARDLIAQLLEHSQADVARAASAAEAMHMLRDFRPHVLISDIGMPETDGFDLIRQVRAMDDPALASIPAAALTAFARSEDRTRALLCGYQMHVAKPVEPAELIATVASLAQGVRPREA